MNCLKQTWTRWLAALGIVAACMALGACNTVEGAGEDIESVGEEIDEEF